MSSNPCQTFDVTIRRAGASYRAEVLSNGGEPSWTFPLPFNKEDLDELFAAMDLQAARHFQSRAEVIRSFGGRLFDAVFGGDIKVCFSTCLAEVKGTDSRLLIRLRLDDVPELAALPWEYIYSRSDQSYLSVSKLTPVIRYLNLSGAPRALLVRPPISVLVVISNPRDYDQLDVEKEWDLISGSLADLVEAGKVSVRRLPHSTTEYLQSELLRSKYHILHYIGHSSFDVQSSTGFLVMEDEQGNGNPVSTEKIRLLLGDQQRLRLIVLNSCESARYSGLDERGGLAQGLVRNGTPAVIAMQNLISDRSSLIFSRHFYDALAEGHPVDSCVANARLATFINGGDIEWGTPVLFMRSPDGLLFEIDRPDEEELLRARIVALERDAYAAMNVKNYEGAVEKLQALIDLSQAGKGSRHWPIIR